MNNRISGKIASLLLIGLLIPFVTQTMQKADHWTPKQKHKISKTCPDIIAIIGSSKPTKTKINVLKNFRHLSAQFKKRKKNKLEETVNLSPQLTRIKKNLSPLEVAIGTWNYKLIELLIEQGSPFECVRYEEPRRFDRNTLAHLAVTAYSDATLLNLLYNNNQKALLELLKHANSGDNKPLNMALKAGKSDILDFFIEKNLITLKHILWTIRKNHYKATKHILLNQQLTPVQYEEIMHTLAGYPKSKQIPLMKILLQKYPAGLNSIEAKTGNSLLITAARYGKKKSRLACWLTKQTGIDLTITDKKKHTVLHYAIKQSAVNLLKKLAKFAVKQDDKETLYKIQQKLLCVRENT